MSKKRTRRSTRLNLINFFPLQRIEIISSTKAHKAGSLGYVSYAYGHVLIIKKLNVFFMRYGKAGKPRISRSTISYNRVDIDTIPEDHQQALDFEIKSGPMLPNTELKPASIDTRDITLLSPYEFVCYLGALGAFIDYLKSMDNRKLVSYSLRNIAAALDDLNNVDIGLLTAIIVSVADNRDLTIKNINLEKMLIDNFESSRNRAIAVEKAHKALAAFRHGVERYHAGINNDLQRLSQYVSRALGLRSGYNINGATPRIINPPRAKVKYAEVRRNHVL